jgi:hypothetical protein
MVSGRYLDKLAYSLLSRRSILRSVGSLLAPYVQIKNDSRLTDGMGI